MMKKVCLLLVLFIVTFKIYSQGGQGFFLNDWEEKSINVPDYIDVAKPIENSSITVTADYTNEVTKVSKYLYGNNGNTYSGNYSADSALVINIRNLSPNVIRWPGGNNANWYFWDRTKGSYPSDAPAKLSSSYWYGKGADASWQTGLDDYYSLLKKTNSTGIICVNYSYARYGTSLDPVATAAHYAADWVRYDNGRTKFWEVGNENYGNWESGYEIDLTQNKDKQPKIITGDLYGKHFRVFADSMRAAATEIGATIYIGAVGYDALAPGGGVIAGWNEGVLPQVKDKADFYIVHDYYTNWNENSTSSVILNSAANTSAPVNTVFKRMDDAGCSHLPVALTEWNIQALGSGQLGSHINGMHSVLVMGELIKTEGYGLATRWGLANYNDGSENDQGMFSWGSATGVPTFNPNCSFYYMYYFQKYFGDKMIASTVSGNSDIKAYASKFSGSGQASFVVVNKGTANKTVTLEVNNFTIGDRYYIYTLTGNGKEFSKKVFVNGETTPFAAGGPDNYATLSPNSSTTNGGIVISAPARSVVFVLIDSVGTTYTNNSVMTRMVVTPRNYSLAVGDTMQFTALGFDQNNNPIEASPLWTISGGGTIDTLGWFIPTIKGVYKVKAVCNSITDSVFISVKDAPIPPACDAFNIGDIIQAESYCSMNGVQTQATTDVGGGNNVGWIDNTDYMDYKLNVVDTGWYYLNFRIASESVKGKVLLQETAPLKTDLAIIDLVVSGNWQTWKTVQGRVHFTSNGELSLRIYASLGGWNFNWFQFSDNSTGLKESSIEHNGIQIFPNPSAGNLFVYSKLLTGNNAVKLKVFDSFGREIYSEDIRNTNSTSIQLPDNICSGIYMITLQDSKQFVSKSLMIKK